MCPGGLTPRRNQSQPSPIAASDLVFGLSGFFLFPNLRVFVNRKKVPNAFLANAEATECHSLGSVAMVFAFSGTGGAKRQ